MSIVSSMPQFNAASLNLVRPELVRLINQARGAYEGVLQSGGSAEIPRSCMDILRQSSGVMRFVELGEAAALAAELAEAMESGQACEEQRTQALRSGFYLLSRYIDYLASQQRSTPELLLDQINELRQLRRSPPLAESHFGVPFDLSIGCPGSGRVPGDARSAALLRRLRHLYQTGLVNVMRGRREPVHLRLMQRATERVLKLLGGGAPAEFWWLLGAVLEGLASGQLQFNASRTRLLSRADRQFKALSGDPDAAGAKLDDALKAELLCLIGRCRDGKAIAEIRQLFRMDEMSLLDDAGIVAERGLLHGPPPEVFDNLLKNVRQLMLPVKQALEQLSENADASVLARIPAAFGNITPLLREADQEAAAAALDQQSQRIADWSGDMSTLDERALSEIADTVMFVEALLDGLARSRGILRSGGGDARSEARQVMARSLLEEARQLVLGETRRIIESMKQDVSEFLAGNSDSAVFEAASGRLGLVRGVLSILGQPKAAETCQRGADAVVAAVQAGQLQAAGESFCESFADVLICLEYYVAALADSEQPDPVMLRVAEESIAALQS